MNLGLGLSLSHRAAGGGGVAAVDLDALTSASIQFPQVNILDASEREGGAVIRLNNTSSIGKFLDPDNGGAMFIAVDLPTETMYRPDSQTICILGNNIISSPIMAQIILAPMGQTNAGKLSFRFSGSGVEETIIHTMSNRIPASTKKALIAVWTEYGTDPAGNMFFGVWDMDTGSQVVATETKAFTNFHGAALRTYEGIGGRVSSTTGAMESNTINFTGAVSLFGIFDNGRVTAGARSASDFASIAAGANPVDVFGTEKFLILRDWSDPSDLDTPVANAEHSLVTKADPLFEAVTLGGFTLQKGGTIRRQTTAAYLVPEHIRSGGVFPVVRGSTSATFSIAGKTSLADGQGVEARVFSTEDGTVALDWTSVATVASNAFTASITCPITKGWANIEFRAASDPTNTNLQSCFRRKMGVGYKLAQFGQSQITILTQFAESESASNMGLADANGAAFSTTRLLSTPTVEHGVTVIMDGDSVEYADGMLAMAKYFRSKTTAPVELAVFAVPGTNQTQLSDDSVSAWDWGSVQTITGVTGADWTAICEQWITAISANYATDFESKIADEWIMGTTAGTSPTITGASASYTRNNSIFGNSNDSDVVDESFGPVFIMLEGTRTGISVDQSPLLDVSEPGGPLTNLEQHRAVRQAQRSFVANNATVYGGVPSVDHYLGALGGHHQIDTSIYGQIRLAIRTAQGFLNGLGLVDFDPPSITSASISGSRITVTYDMKGHGDLTVGTDLTGVAVPSGYPSLSGWEVDEGSGFSLSGFTASINGTNQVFLDKDGDVDWASSVDIQYGWGAPFSRDIDTDAEVQGSLYADNGVNTATDFGKAEAGLPVLAPDSVTAT